MNFKIPFNPHHSVFSDMELGGAVCVSDDGCWLRWWGALRFTGLTLTAFSLTAAGDPQRLQGPPVMLYLDCLSVSKRSRFSPLPFLWLRSYSWAVSSAGVCSQDSARLCLSNSCVACQVFLSENKGCEELNGFHLPQVVSSARLPVTHCFNVGTPKKYCS